MTKIMMAQLILLIFTVSTQFAQAGLLYNYSQLKLKDLDQMSKIVRDKVKESNTAGGDQVIPLKEGIQAVYSRPDDDGMIEKIITPLKSALDEHNAWESTIKQLVKEAVGALKNPKAFKPIVQVTYLIFLENIVSDLKPRGTQEFEKSVLTQIRDAKVEISKEAKNERILRMMKESPSPSAAAEEALKAIEIYEKEQALLPKPTTSPAAAPVKK